MFGYAQHIHAQPLDVPLLVEPSLLETIWSIVIDGRVDTLHFPRIGLRGQPPAPHVVRNRSVDRAMRDERWGHAYHQGPASQVEIQGLAFVYQFKEDAFSDQSGPSEPPLADEDMRSRLPHPPRKMPVRSRAH